MAGEIVKRDTALSEIQQLGGVFKASGYFKDVRDEAQAVVKILYGQELGLSPVVSMMGIHIVEGKPELSANLLASKVKTSGRYDYRVRSQTDTECTLAFLQDGEEVGESTFTIDDAKRAGIVRQGSGWTKYPKAMLFARALSQGVRTHCPDVGVGVPVYVAGEISGEDTTPDGGFQRTAAGPVLKPEAEEQQTETIEATLEPPVQEGFISTDDRNTLIKSFRQALGKRGEKAGDWKEQLAKFCARNDLTDEAGNPDTSRIRANSIQDVTAALMDFAVELTAEEKRL